MADTRVVVTREERRQRRFGKQDKLGAAFVRPLQPPPHALHRGGPRFSRLDRPELRGRDGNDAGQAKRLRCKQKDAGSPKLRNHPDLLFRLRVTTKHADGLVSRAEVYPARLDVPRGA